MKSPCTGVCQVEKELCKGCKRTLTEIANWTKYTDAQRNKIMKEVKRR